MCIISGGKGCNPESVAKNMFSALKKYIHSSDYKSTLKTIRIVIFQADMVKKFVDASNEESKGSFSKLLYSVLYFLKLYLNCVL